MSCVLLSVYSVVFTDSIDALSKEVLAMKLEQSKNMLEQSQNMDELKKKGLSQHSFLEYLCLFVLCAFAAVSFQIDLTQHMNDSLRRVASQIFLPWPTPALSETRSSYVQAYQYYFPSNPEAAFCQLCRSTVYDDLVGAHLFPFGARAAWYRFGTDANIHDPRNLLCLCKRHEEMFDHCELSLGYDPLSKVFCLMLSCF